MTEIFSRSMSQLSVDGSSWSTGADAEEIASGIIDIDGFGADDRWVSPIDRFQASSFEELEAYLEDRYCFSLRKWVLERAPQPRSVYHGLMLVNYLRMSKEEGRFDGNVAAVQAELLNISPSSPLWADEKLIVPFLSDDPLLRAMAQLEDESADECVEHVVAEPLPSVDYLRDQAARIAADITEYQ